MIQKTCKQCGATFSVKNYRKDSAQFCSYSCTAKYRYHHTPELRKAFSKHKSGKEHPMWNGGKTVNSQGYVLIHTPEHPHCSKRGYVREHRLVMEKKLGRYLEPNEVVHHKNGKKDDNRIENLELMKKKDHDRVGPNVFQKGKQYKKVCPECGEVFYVTPSLLRIVCCSQSCSKKKQWREQGASSFGR
jgi:hypothetical protein